MFIQIQYVDRSIRAKEIGVRTRLLRNSWGPSWGEAGLFKIKRGINDCGIESPNNLLISDPP